MIPQKAESCAEGNEFEEVNQAGETEEDEEDMRVSPAKIFQDVGLLDAFRGKSLVCS